MPQVFFSKVVGTTFEGRQDVLEDILEEIGSGQGGHEPNGWQLELRRQPGNPHDRNAIALYWRDGRQIGFLERSIAESLAPQIDDGRTVEVVLIEVTGIEPGFNMGANLRIEVSD